MARGRPPKPVEQRRLEGGSTVSHRPVPEPLLVAGRPDLQRFAIPPAELPEDAVEFWGDTVRMLAEVGVIDLVDTPAAVMMAIQYARSKQAGRVIAAKGLFGHGAAGQIKEAPWVKTEREAQMAFYRMLSDFGMTPVARVRLGLAELHHKAMSREMDEAIGGRVIPIDAEVVEDDDDVGLPG